MAERTVVVGSAAGLHARPARIFTKAASGTGVTIATEASEPVDASSILRVMSLGIASGQTVTLALDGDDTADLDRLADLLASDLDAAQ